MFFCLERKEQTHTYTHTDAGADGVAQAPAQLPCLEGTAYITNSMAAFLGHVMFSHRQAQMRKWIQITGKAEPLHFQACNKCADCWQARDFEAFFIA